MNETSIASIQKQSKIKLNMSSRTEASMTSAEIGSTKENERLTQLKQKIQDAQYACKLMEAFEEQLKRAYGRLGE